MRRLAIACVVIGVCGSATSPSATPATPIDELLAAYVASGPAAIEKTLKDQDAFEQLRKQIADATTHVWALHRERVQSVFILETAFIAMRHGWRNWLDVLKLGREFIMSRPDPPGAKPDDDEFEIAWHKAAVALIEGQRRPDFLEDVLDVTISGGDQPPPIPLVDRMAAVPAAPGELPRLVDPWIELTRGIYDEEAMAKAEVARAATGMATTPATSVNLLGQAAIDAFTEAAKYPSVREEALVRKAWVLIRLGRPGDALTALDALGDAPSDPDVRYWRPLFRGRALADLGRDQEAADAFTNALRVVPKAQSATVALSFLAFRHGQADDAAKLAAAVRSPAAVANDPWWVYPIGENRFFLARLQALRDEVRR